MTRLKGFNIHNLTRPLCIVYIHHPCIASLTIIVIYICPYIYIEKSTNKIAYENIKNGQGMEYDREMGYEFLACRKDREKRDINMLVIKFDKNLKILVHFDNILGLVILLSNYLIFINVVDILS